MAAFCLLPQSPSFHSLFPECWILLPTSKTGFPAYSRSSSNPYGTLPHINLLKSLSCTIPFNRYSLLGRYGLESKTKEFVVDPVFIRCTLSTSSFHYQLTFTLPLSQIGLLCLQQVWSIPASDLVSLAILLLGIPHTTIPTHTPAPTDSYLNFEA